MCLNFWPFSRKKQFSQAPASRAQEDYAKSTPYEVPARVTHTSADGDDAMYHSGHAGYRNTPIALGPPSLGPPPPGPPSLGHASPPGVSYGGRKYGPSVDYGSGSYGSGRYGGGSYGGGSYGDGGYGAPDSFSSPTMPGHFSPPQQQQQQAYELPGTDLEDGWRVTTASSAPRGDIERPVRAMIK